MNLVKTMLNLEIPNKKKLAPIKEPAFLKSNSWF